RGLSRHRSPAAAAVSGSKITELRALDVRFPTSRTLAGSDAMNTAPDYSATYVILSTDRGDGLAGHGLTFTIGRGTEVLVAPERVGGRPVRRPPRHHRRDHPRRSARASQTSRADQTRTRGRDAARRLPRVHDLRGLARLLRRKAPRALPRGRERGLDAREDEGRARHPGRRPPRADRARGAGYRPAA